MTFLFGGAFLVALGLLLTAIGVALFYLMLVVAVVTVLMVHGRVYFMDDYAGRGKPAMYFLVLSAMLGMAATMTPGLRAILGQVEFVVRPRMAMPFVLAAIYFSFGLRMVAPGLRHQYWAGAVYLDLIRSSIRALPGVWEGAKKATPWASTHWVGFLAAIAALVIGLPIAIGVLLVSTVAGLLFAVLWGGVLALPMLVLMVVFEGSRRSGAQVPCPRCRKVHAMPGPGPWGLFRVRCACGESLDLWAAGKKTGQRAPLTVWYKRERNLGTRSLLAISLAGALTVLLLGGATVGFTKTSMLLPSWFVLRNAGE